MGATFYYSDPWGFEYFADCPIFATADDGSWAACETQLPNDHCLDPMCNATDPIVGSFVINVNNVTAPCLNATSGASVCAYTFDPYATPTITSFNVSDDGLNISLTGALLVASDPVTRIFVGGSLCTGLTQVSLSTVSCSLPVGIVPAGLASAIAGYTSQGTINTTLKYTFPLVVNAFSASGSAAGGTAITIQGRGFDTRNLSSNVVYLSSPGNPPSLTSALLSYSAYITNATASQTEATLTFLTPPVPAAFGGASSVAYDINVAVSQYVSTNVINGGNPNALNTITTKHTATASVAAAFTYLASLTPSISGIYPRSGPPGTTLVIYGTGFANTTSDVASSTVTIAGESCAIAVALSNATAVVCVIGSVPAGVYPVLVTVPGAGLATQAPSGLSDFAASAVVTSVSRSVVGLGGGLSITLTGAGFASAPSTALTLGQQAVTVCNSPCTVTSATPTSLTCTTGPLVTQAAVSDLRIWQASALQPAAGTVSPSLEKAVDGDVGTSLYLCAPVIDLGPTTRGIVTRVSFFPTFRLTSNLASAVFAGSNDQVSWTTLARAPSTPSEGWNSIAILDEFAFSSAAVNYSAATPYRYLRMQIVSGNCWFQELQWTGYAVAALPPASDECPIYLTVAGPSEPRAILASITPSLASSPPPTLAVTLNQTLSYSLAVTPRVTSIS